MAPGSPAKLAVVGTGNVGASFAYAAVLWGLASEIVLVDARSVHAFIVGEHGDSEVPVWSMANIAGMSLEAFAAANQRAHDQAALDGIFVHTRDAAYEIIERKGSTHFAVAAGLLRIVEAILRDQRTVLSVSSRMDPSLGLGEVFLSLPAIVGRAGVERVLHLPLAADELEGLRRSAAVLRDVLSSLERAATSARP